MGEKVSKMKKGIINNLVKKVEFDEASKITTQEMIDLLAAITAQNNRSVTQFCITGANVLTDDAAKSMNTLLKGYSTETVKERKAGSLGIALKECDFSSQGLNALLTSFFYCDIVGELIIHGTFKPLEESSIQGLEQVLMGQGTKCCISKLELKGFAVSSKITRALVELMAKQKIVKQLYLLKFEVRADAVKILLQQSSLELLDLSGCEIADAHIDTMTEALQQNTTLKKLVLDDNNITDAGVQKLIQGISENKVSTLESISLARNPIESEAIVTSLQQKLTERLSSLGAPQSPSVTAANNTKDIKTNIASAILGEQNTTAQPQQKTGEFLEYI